MRYREYISSAGVRRKREIEKDENNGG